MACELHVVKLDTDAAPHDQVITFDDVSFNPKACICVGALDGTLNLRENSAIWSRGFWGYDYLETDPPADGIKSRQHCYVGQKNDCCNGQAHRENQGGSIHLKYNASGSFLAYEFNIKSIVAGSCTIEITTQLGTGPHFIFLFIDAENACVGTDITPDDLGNDTITHDNLDFTPDCIFFAGDQNETLDDFDADDTWGWFGFTAGPSDNLSICWYGDDAGGSVNSQLNHTYAMMMHNGKGYGTPTIIEAANVSMGDSEFVMDYDTKPGTPKYFMFLALKLDNVYVGNDEATSANTSPDQEITGVGFQPQGVMFLSGNHTAFDEDKDMGYTTGLGVVNGFAAERLGETSDTAVSDACMTITGRASSPENMERRTDDDTAFRTISISGGTAENVGTVSAWDADGFDIDWSISSTKKFGFIALNHTPGGAGFTVEPSALAGLWSIAGAGISKGVDPSALAGLWSIAGAGISKGVASGAISGAWSVVGPSLAKSLAQSPVAGTWAVAESAVAKTIAAPSPLVGDWVVVGPSLAKSLAQSPVAGTWAVAEAVVAKTIAAPSPLVGAWSVVGPAIMETLKPDPVSGAWSIPGVGIVRILKPDPVSGTWAIVAPGGVIIGERGPYFIEAADAFIPGIETGHAFLPGLEVGGVYIPGLEAGV